MMAVWLTDIHCSGKDCPWSWEGEVRAGDPELGRAFVDHLEHAKADGKGLYQGVHHSFAHGTVTRGVIVGAKCVCGDAMPPRSFDDPYDWVQCRDWFQYINHRHGPFLELTLAEYPGDEFLTFRHHQWTEE